MISAVAVAEPPDLRGLLEHIGVEQPVVGWNSQASRDAVRHFTHGYGDDSAHWGTGEADHDGGAIPPTFLYSVCSGGRANGLPGPAELLPGTAAVWLGDMWNFHRPVHLHEALSATVAIESVTPKVSRSRGASVLVCERFEFRDGQGKNVASYVKTTMRFARREGNQEHPSPVPEPFYTGQELDELARSVVAEADRRRGDETRAASTVAVGDSLGTLVKGPLSLTSIIAWVAGWGSPYLQTDRLAHRGWLDDPTQRMTVPSTGRPESIEAPHWEPELAAVSGLPRGYDFGAQRICWLVHLVTDWAGNLGQVRALDAQIIGPNLIGDLTTISGSVAQLIGDDAVCQVEAINQRGEITARATVTVTLTSDNNQERVQPCI